MVGGKRKEEAGYALIYALGAIILASVIVGAIFLFAIRTFAQIDRVDQFKQSQEVGEYALQKGTKKIKDTLEEKLATAIVTNTLGQDETTLKSLVNNWILPSTVTEIAGEKVGSQQQFSYQVIYESTRMQAKKSEPYKLSEGEPGFGWLKESYQTPDARTNVQLVFPLTVEVTETHNGHETITKINANYIYEIQWEQVDSDNTIQGMDAWRNVFYSYYLPSSETSLSADEWLKKMMQLYRYQAGAEKAFDYGNYSSQQSPLYGDYQSHIADVTDNRPLDFTTGDKKIGSLRFAGSFLVEYGPRMRGNPGSLLQTGNLLSLRNSPKIPQRTNLVQVETVKAATGTFIELPVPKSSLILDVADFQTNNLLINGTHTESQASSTQGVLLAKGQLSLSNQLEANNLSFAQYATNSQTQDPKLTNWNEFLKGGLVVSSGSLYAGPVSQSGINSTVMDSRKIDVEGNFLLTNVLMKQEEESVAFSYFTGAQPETPSRITLKGANTQLTVKGLSFIDAVKVARRKSYSEYPKDKTNLVVDTKTFAHFYDDEAYWNHLLLKEGAKMELGYTGVEPFHLEVDKKSSLSLKILPGNLLFDTRFLEEMTSKGQLKGRVILQPYSEDDATALEKDLKHKGIKVASVTELTTAKESTALEGKVVLVKPTKTTNQGASEIITRTFDYVESLEY